jgi:hypothetical protein
VVRRSEPTPANGIALQEFYAAHTFRWARCDVQPARDGTLVMARRYRRSGSSPSSKELWNASLDASVGAD